MVEANHKLAQTVVQVAVVLGLMLVVLEQEDKEIMAELAQKHLII